MDESISQLLVKWRNGDQTAFDALTPLVYDELRRMADSYLRRRRNQTLQPTALVHEAWLRLVDQPTIDWQHRAQFFGMASTIMRNILVDHARRRRASKRGSGDCLLSLAHADRFGNEPEVDLVRLDDALQDLAKARPRPGRIVELRFFGGLTIEETAEILGVSSATVEREWNLARAWLRHHLSR